MCTESTLLQWQNIRYTNDALFDARPSMFPEIQNQIVQNKPLTNSSTSTSISPFSSTSGTSNSMPDSIVSANIEQSSIIGHQQRSILQRRLTMPQRNFNPITTQNYQVRSSMLVPTPMFMPSPMFMTPNTTSHQHQHQPIGYQSIYVQQQHQNINIIPN